jgi:hypothetical protein
MPPTYSSVTEHADAGLQSMASSATSVYFIAPHDNTEAGDPCDDLIVQVELDFASTAPDADPVVYLVAQSSLDGTNWAYGAGAAGAQTIPSIETGPLGLVFIAVLPYRTADENRAYPARAVAEAFGGVLPPHVQVGLVNVSGASTAASGNAIRTVRVSYGG